MCCCRIQTIPEWNRPNNGWLEHNIIHVSNDACLVLDSFTGVCLKCNNLRILCCPNHCCSQEIGTGYHSRTPGSPPPPPPPPPPPRFFVGSVLLIFADFLVVVFFVCFCLRPVSCTICYLCLWIVHSVFSIVYFLCWSLYKCTGYSIFFKVT